MATPHVAGAAALLSQAHPDWTGEQLKDAFDDMLVARGRTPLKEGVHRYKAVYAGEGGKAAYSGLGALGKAAVVRRSDAVGLAEQAAHAAKAGAKLLLVVNDGAGRLDPWPIELDSPYAETGNPPPLTVASLTADEGKELISQIKRGRSTAFDRAGVFRSA